MFPWDLHFDFFVKYSNWIRFTWTKMLKWRFVNDCTNDLLELFSNKFTNSTNFGGLIMPKKCLENFDSKIDVLSS